MIITLYKLIKEEKQFKISPSKKNKLLIIVGSYYSFERLFKNLSDEDVSKLIGYLSKYFETDPDGNNCYVLRYSKCTRDIMYYQTPKTVISWLKGFIQ